MIYFGRKYTKNIPAKIIVSYIFLLLTAVF
ncbi:MAG: hypothetical protein H6Q20_156 [Bacteroidetes bacterium]|nr:hypothetical protein [Bacteroidota bacterium]